MAATESSAAAGVSKAQVRRCAVVTGGTGAIGSAICASLLEQGCAVVAIGHPTEQQSAQNWRARFCARADIEALYADLQDAAAAGEAMHVAQTRLGRIDILVNAAGITRDARFVKMTPEQWRSVLATNLDSVFYCCKAVFEAMCQRGHGRIVNIASVNGQRGQFGQANYAAAKAGMHGVTMTLAQEGARHGVTVNTVSPGYISTPMTAAIKPEALHVICAQIPVGRMGEPADIARTVSFLCAEDAGYITGANIPVNGGLYMSF
jgi:acetoacetyl-CoA reductase